MKINFLLYVKRKNNLDDSLFHLESSNSVSQGSMINQKNNSLFPLMAKHRVPTLIPFLLVLWLVILVQPSFSTEISTVDAKLHGNGIYINASVKPDQKFIEDVQAGLSKELVIYLDLFRAWNVWPDEFILGRKIVRVLKSDPIKREYIAVSLDDNIRREKRFKDLETMIEWAMNISEEKLSGIGGLETGTYFVKVTFESRLKQLPPVIGYLFFFVPEKEFSVSRVSPSLQIQKRGQ